MPRLLTSIMMFVFLILANVLPVHASTVTYSLFTSKETYNVGELVTINGTVLKDGQAGKGVNPSIKVTGPSEEVVFVTQFNDSDISSSGAIQTSFTLSSNAPLGTYTLTGTAGTVNVLKRFTVTGDTSKKITVVTNEANYADGGTIVISGVYTVGGQGVANVPVAVILSFGGDRTVDQVTTDANGSYSSRMVLPRGSQPGTYSIRVAAAGTEASTSVNVAQPVVVAPVVNPPAQPTPTTPVTPVPLPTNPVVDEAAKKAAEEAAKKAAEEAAAKKAAEEAAVKKAAEEAAAKKAAEEAAKKAAAEVVKKAAEQVKATQAQVDKVSASVEATLAKKMQDTDDAKKELANTNKYAASIKVVNGKADVKAVATALGQYSAIVDEFKQGKQTANATTTIANAVINLNKKVDAAVLVDFVKDNVSTKAELQAVIKTLKAKKISTTELEKYLKTLKK